MGMQCCRVCLWRLGKGRTLGLNVNYIVFWSALKMNLRMHLLVRNSVCTSPRASALVPEGLTDG